MKRRSRHSAASRKKMGDSQRASWKKNYAQRAVAVRQALQRPETRAKMSAAKTRQYASPSTTAPPKRISNLETVRQRQALREATAPLMDHDPARATRIEGHARKWRPTVTHIATPPPAPELSGMQKLLCGKLA